jgi:predicted deacylase
MRPVRFELSPPDLGPWRQGNTGVEGLWHFQSGRPGRHVLISALIHGNELCGAWAVKELLESGLRPQAGQLTLMLANLSAFDRFDPRHHDASRFVEEDMNRQWTAERIAHAHTAERRRVAELAPWVDKSDWLLDLHSMHEPGPPLLLTGLQARNRELALQLGASAHIVVDAGHRDGVRMRDFGRFGLSDAQAGDTRSLLIECGFHGDPRSLLVARDICLRFLRVSGVVESAYLEGVLPGWAQGGVAQPSVLEVTDAVVARSERFSFTQPWEGLSCIESAGTVIGDNDGEPVRTPYDQCVLVMPSVRQARAGVTVVRFARRLTS